MIRILVAVALLVAFVGSASAAPPTDVADLFPPGTLAYAELHNPAEFGPQLSALFKGTPLEDSIAFIESRKSAAKTINELTGKRELAELALFVSPEVLTEFRKLGGVAVALTGFNDRGEPELVLAVLTGDSGAAGLAARAFITTSTTLRKVSEVSKVPVFQHRPPNVNYGPDGVPKIDNTKAPTEGPHEPTYAYTPGLFVMGTSKAALAPVIKRFREEEKGTLRATDGFKAAATEYRKPGLFFYANAPELFAKAGEAGRARGEAFDFDLIAMLRIAGGPKALKSFAGCVQFRDGGAAITASFKIDPKEKSPVAEFFSGPPVKVDTLHHARKPATFAATVNLPEKNRAEALVGMLDVFAKATGELGRLPSEVVRNLQNTRKVPANNMLAKVRAVTVIVPPKQDLPKGAKPIPMFVLHLEPDAGPAWEEFLPKLVADIAGETNAAQPSSETVAGVKVMSLPGTELPWKSAVHFARKDATLVIGQDRKLVAAALVPDAATSVAGDKFAVPNGDLALLGTVNIGAVLTSIELPPTTGRPGMPFGPPRDILGEKMAEADVLKEVDKARTAFLAAFGELPPAVVSVRRTGDELKFEVYQPKVQNGGLTPVINAAVNWFDKRMNLRDPNRIDFEDDFRPRRGKW